MTTPEKNKIIALRVSTPSGPLTKDDIENVNKDPVLERLHQFIRVEKPHFLPIVNPVDLFKPYYVHPKMSNRRIVAQTGGFIIYGLKRASPIKFSAAISLTKFTVPFSRKAEIRKSLDDLGINDSTLFPEIDRAAKRIERRYAV